MIQSDHNGRGHQDAPIPVEGQERQRAEDVEVRLDTAACQMDQQARHQHLAYGNGMARKRVGGADDSQEYRQAGDRAAQKYRQPDVQVHLADPHGPAQARGSDPQRRRDSQRPTGPAA